MAEDLGPPPGHEFCVYHGIPLTRPPPDMDWWAHDVCATQRMPTDDEPKLLDLVLTRVPVDGKEQHRGAADVVLLRRALGLPPPAAETREAIKLHMNGLTEPEKATERLCRSMAEFTEIAPNLAPPIPACARARDMHWLLAEPAWNDDFRRVKATLQDATSEEVTMAYCALCRAILKCRWLVAHRSDQLVDIAAAEPSRALEAACARIYQLIHEVDALDLDLIGEARFMPARTLASKLLQQGESLPGQVEAGTVQPWTGVLAGQLAQRFEAACVHEMREMLRAQAAAAAAAVLSAPASGAAAAAGSGLAGGCEGGRSGQGGKDQGANVTLGFVHTAESVHALALLGELALALDAYARLVDPDAAGRRVLSAYAQLQRIDPSIVPLPEGSQLDPRALPWLVRLPQWRAMLPDAHLPCEGVAELDVGLAHAVMIEAVQIEDARCALTVESGAHAARDTLRTQVHTLVVQIAELAPQLSAGEQGRVDALARMTAKQVASFLMREPFVEWQGVRRGAGTDQASRPPLLATWEEELWSAICQRRAASADDAAVALRIGMLGLTLDQLSELAAQRGASSGRKRARRGSVVGVEEQDGATELEIRC